MRRARARWGSIATPVDSADDHRAVDGRQGTSHSVLPASPARSKATDTATADGLAQRLALTRCTAAGPTGPEPGVIPGRACAYSGREIRRIPARTQMSVYLRIFGRIVHPQAG